MLFLIINYFRKRATEWIGIVIDKGTTQSYRTTSVRRSPRVNVGPFSLGQNNRHININYYVVVETDSGKEIRWNISEGLYEVVKVGDKLKKDKGTTIPRVIEKAETQDIQGQ